MSNTMAATPLRSLFERLRPGVRGRAALMGLACALLLGVSLKGSPALAIEEPKFTVALQQGAFEVRDYAGTIVAEVTVAGDQKAAARQGFRLLAGYIFGGNTKRQSIAMTAPVSQKPTSETIAMTAPVSQVPTDGGWVVRFTMPSAYTLTTLPEPNDQRVRLKAVPPARFAVVRFSGYANEAMVKAKTAELEAFVKQRHLKATGPAWLAQYNPPWTLWFMRRNEVMLPLAP